MERWDPGSFEGIAWAWPSAVMGSIGSVLKLRKEKVDRAKVAFSELQPLSIHFDGSVSKRKVAPDREYTMGLQFARPGNIVVAKIDLKNGAVGIVPPGWENVAVTGHFAVYEPIREKLLPEFFHLIIQAPFFKANLWRNKVGAEGRKEVKLDFFEAQPIPLPPLATQRAIVAHWRATQESLAATAQANDTQEAAIRRNFLEALGLSDRIQVINRRAFALHWTEFERWGVEQARKVSGSLDPAEGKFPVVRLREIIVGLQNGWSPKCFDRPAGADEWGVLKLGAVSFGTFNEGDNKALPPSFTPLPAHEVKPDDVLFIRGNVLRLVGACSHVAATRPRLMMPDLVFRAVFREESKIDRRYLAEVMRTPHLRQQIEAVATGTSPTMKKISKPGLLALRLPLPPLAIQRQLVAAVTAARSRIAAARTAAAQLAADTAREVEEMILGVRPSPVFLTAKTSA